MMDKVQVDAKRLQLLNDRINQTIDAINQLRQTALQPGLGASAVGQQGFGMQHSPVGQGAVPFAQVPYGVSVSQPFGSASPFGGLSPYAQGPYAAGVAGMPYGFSHSSWIDPTAAIRQQMELAALAQARPYGVPAYGQLGLPGIGALFNAMGGGMFGGIGHTGYGYGYRSPALEVILGAYDPVARQLELVRASEANRAWEIAQGIGHTPATVAPWVQSPFASSPYATPAWLYSAFPTVG